MAKDGRKHELLLENTLNTTVVITKESPRLAFGLQEFRLNSQLNWKHFNSEGEFSLINSSKS